MNTTMQDNQVQRERMAEQHYDDAYEFYFKGNWEAAEYHIKECVELFPREPRYRLLLAQTYCALNCLQEAEGELKILKMHDPANPGAKSLEALLKSKQQKPAVNTRRQADGSSISGLFKQLFGH